MRVFGRCTTRTTTIVLLFVTLLVVCGIVEVGEIDATLSEQQAGADSCLSFQTDHEATQPPPPFQPPPDNSTTALTGIHNGLQWRLFSPDPEVFNPGNFRVCFDVKCGVADAMVNLLVILMNDESSLWYWNQWTRSSNQVVQTSDGSYQYLVWSNSTYWYLNMSCLDMWYPTVENHMHCVIHVNYATYQNALVNVTVPTNTIPPEVMVVSYFDGGNSMLVSANDTNGIKRAYVAGYDHIDDTYGPVGAVVIAENDTVGSDSVIVLRIDQESLWDFACSMGQEGDQEVHFPAVLGVVDNADMETQIYFYFVMSNTMLNVTVLYPELNEFTRVCSFGSGNSMLVLANDTDGIKRAYVAGYHHIDDTYEPVGAVVIAENDTVGSDSVIVLRIDQESLWDFACSIDQENSQPIVFPALLVVIDNSNMTTRIYFTLTIANMVVEYRQWLTVGATGLVIAVVIVSLEYGRRRKTIISDKMPLGRENGPSAPPNTVSRWTVEY